MTPPPDASADVPVSAPAAGRLPRLVVAAPATGQGKTTVSIGLMAALTRAGHAVSGHKVGPDYIDPGYHALACGRPGRNLDPHLVGEHRVAPLLLHGAAGADVAVIEGVMGLHDGRIGGDGFSSTAHVATLTRSPVVLVVDISRSSRSIGAVVHGLATYDPHVEVVGVILNKAGSPRHAREVADSVRLPVLGVVGRDEAFSAPSRHLGLVPAAERDEARHSLDRLADHLTEVVDLERVLDVARAAPDLDVEPWDPAAEVVAPGQGRPVVAVAGGRAFTFRYAETEELLRTAGCDVVPFDPMHDPALPPGTRGVYLGGGFPEVHAAALTANAPLRAALRSAVAAGVPTVAECAGLLYLCDSVDDQPMVGAITAAATMTPRLTLRYPTAVAASDSLLTRAGESVTGHEFHRTHTEPPAGPAPAWTVDGHDVGFATGTLHASYLHTHWAGHPQLAQRFADAVHAHADVSAPTEAATPRGTPAPGDDDLLPPTTTGPAPRAARAPLLASGTTTGTRPEERSAPLQHPLLHHGDTEVGPDLLDLAVNVYPGPRPTWLEDALRDSLADLDRYPDAAEARAALAARHRRPADEVLPTAGAAEAFTLVARARAWRSPVVVHPQFTEPHAALLQAGLTVYVAHTRAEDGFTLSSAHVPEDADLVVVGNPTNPTGVLHRAEDLRALLRPGRVVVVDEAFMDTVPGEPESLTGERHPGLVVVRSLTKHWSVPGVRAGYLLGDPALLADLRAQQVPWSVSTPAAAAMLACAGDHAHADALLRARTLGQWREVLHDGLEARGIPHVTSSTSFVLARVGEGVHAGLRTAGIAVRRADTFPGLGPDWVRIAVRPEPVTLRLLDALSTLSRAGSPIP